MTEKRGILSDRKWDIGGHDDVDAIADTWRRKALLRPLLRPKTIAKLMSVEYSFGHLVIAALMRIDSPEVADTLVGALDVEDVRLSIVDALRHKTRSTMRVAASPALRARFERAIATIEQARKAGLPNRVEMAVAGALAALVRRDDEMARATARVFDLIPGFKSATPEVVTPFAELLVESIDASSPAELLQIAKLMTLEPKERLVATAAAWVRLDAEQAKTIAARFHEGDQATVELRWRAVARAYLAWDRRSPAILALIPERAIGAVIAERPDDAPAEIARAVLLDLVKKARNPAELLAAVRAASARREGSVVRALLGRLRETAFRIDAELESLLPALFVPDMDDWVEQEIDGENPFRDRREALKRALAKARAVRA